MKKQKISLVGKGTLDDKFTITFNKLRVGQTCKVLGVTLKDGESITVQHGWGIVEHKKNKKTVHKLVDKKKK